MAPAGFCLQPPALPHCMQQANFVLAGTDLEPQVAIVLSWLHHAQHASQTLPVWPAAKSLSLLLNAQPCQKTVVKHAEWEACCMNHLGLIPQGGG